MEPGRSTLWTVDAGDGHQAVPMLPHGGFPAAALIFFLGRSGTFRPANATLVRFELHFTCQKGWGTYCNWDSMKNQTGYVQSGWVYPRFESRTSFPRGMQWAHQSSKSIMSLSRQRSHRGVTSTASELRWPNKIWIDSKRSTPSATRWAGTPSERKGGVLQRT